MTATFDPRTAPAVTFNARNAEAYEQVMGQWSRRLAPLLIRFGGLADGDRVVDVGCGTGSLTFTLPEIANVAAVRGVQLSKVTSTVEGDIDLLGILGLSDGTVRNGYQQIKVTIHVEGDADDATLRAIVEQSRRRSAVYDVLTQPTPVAIEVVTG